MYIHGLSIHNTNTQNVLCDSYKNLTFGNYDCSFMSMTTCIFLVRLTYLFFEMPMKF